MATYPDDATAPITAFPVVAEVKFTNTGSANTFFNLPGTVSHGGEVAAFIDGVLQQTTTYDVSNGGASVTFTTVPDASNLTLKTISLPQRFRLTRTFPSVRSVDYSNTSAVVVNSNSYLINANTETFALPSGVNVSSSADFMVFIGGLFQDSTSYTYPSVTLGSQGIDIGDNTATKLLLNFNSNATATSTTDASPSAHTVAFSGDARTDNTVKQYGESSLKLDGTGDFLSIADSTDFDLYPQDFTLEAMIKLDTGVTTNSTIFSKFESASTYYALRVVGATSNVAFISRDPTNDANITLNGGNVNGAVFYHVAVSHDYSTNNVMLFVNNVLVSNGIFATSNVAGQTMDGPVEIGRANSISEPFKGHIDGLRISHARRYYNKNSTTVATADASVTEPTVIGGAPLGAIQEGDTLSIRVFDAEISTTDRFNSMADRKPDKGFTTSHAFDVATFTSQSGYEKRRLKSRRTKRAYSLQYTNITGVEKTAITNFFNARSGGHEAFNFDLSHLSESGTITARFEGPLNVDQVLSTGANLLENFYTVSFNLQEVYD